MQAATQQKLCVQGSAVSQCSDMGMPAALSEGHTGEHRGGKGADLRLNIDSRPCLTLKDTAHSAALST